MPRKKLDESLHQVNNDLIEMGRAVEISIDRAVMSFKTQDLKLAKSVRTYLDTVDSLEKNIEKETMRILMLQHPVAQDFRLLSTALKLITDMQRIADQAYNIAEITRQLVKSSFITDPQFLLDMAEKSKRMVSRSLDALINRDEALAQQVISDDDEVDALFVSVRNEVVKLIHADTNNGEQAIDLMMIAKYLERIADHAVNIASWVIYINTGQHPNLEDPEDLEAPDEPAPLTPSEP